MRTATRNPVARAIASIRKHGFLGFLIQAATDVRTLVLHKTARIRDHGGKFELIGSPRDSKFLIVILAGYKPNLWPLTLARIKRLAPANADICIATAGKHSPDVAEWCRNHDCSYLWTRKNKTGLALNKAIDAHPKARWIFKIDEDIFVPENFFEDMLSGYQSVISEGVHTPGFCAPTLNINGVSYLNFLRVTQKTEAYLQAFGELRSACDGVHIHFDPNAATWIWRNTLPFDEVAAKFAATHAADSPVPVEIIGTRFSIGAILLERNFLDEIGGFRCSWRQGMLGVDEQALCIACVDKSRVMLYFTHILAGHFSFYPQEKAMRAQLPHFATMDPVTFELP